MREAFVAELRRHGIGPDDDWLCEEYDCEAKALRMFDRALAAYTTDRAAVLRLLTDGAEAAAIHETQEWFDGTCWPSDVRVLGLTIDQLRAAVAVADYHYPAWRKDKDEVAAGAAEPAGATPESEG